MTPSLKKFMTREFQSPQQIAELGEVSKSRVYAAIKSGELPAKKYTPRLFRIRTVVALKWLEIPFPEVGTVNE